MLIVMDDLCISVEESEMFDFRGLRLDWFRLQVRDHSTLLTFSQQVSS